jgi:hypothetical protein
LLDTATRFLVTPLRRALRRPALDAEDPGHDHVEGDRLHARRQRKGLVQRPVVDLAFGRVGDRLWVAVDRLAVEGREQQLALAHVPLAKWREHRVRPDNRAQRRFAGERRRFVGLGREQRAHVVGKAGDDQVVGFGRAQREDVAQLAFGAEDELDLALVEMQKLEQRVDVDERRRRKALGLIRVDRPGAAHWCADGGGHGWSVT